MWRTPQPSVFYVELPWYSRQPITGRLATHPGNTTVRYEQMTFIEGCRADVTHNCWPLLFCSAFVVTENNLRFVSGRHIHVRVQ